MIRNSDYNVGGKLTSRPPREYIRVSSFREFEDATPEERRVGAYVTPNQHRVQQSTILSATNAALSSTYVVRRAFVSPTYSEVC